MKRAFLLTLFLSSLPATAFALPQFSVLSARRCDNCHVDPQGWEDPAVPERKCSLSCTTCHVNPTGGGLRTTAGRYYGREILAMFGFRPSDDAADHPAAGPATRPSGAATSVQASLPPPGPGTKSRYAGDDPTPWFRVGADVRAMGYFPQARGENDVFFPMQTDLYLAASPYNPDGYNEGRVTVVLNGGALGSRGEQFDNFQDRFLLREWWVLAHDFPYQAYAKLGQFLPVFGWRLDDHTAFIRQTRSFDNERQVTGLEVGINPNYLYAHASVYAPGPQNTRGVGDDRHRLAVLFTREDGPDSPWTAFDTGWGTAWSAGWRDLWWQAGGSVMYENRPDRQDVWAGVNWALNMHEGRHPWKKLNWFPVVYLGEFDYMRGMPDGGRSVDALAAFHEVDILFLEGLYGQVRYDWHDPDLEIRDDHRHRLTTGLVWHPYTYVELIAQVRNNFEPNRVRNDEALLQVHFWY